MTHRHGSTTAPTPRRRTAGPIGAVAVVLALLITLACGGGGDDGASGAGGEGEDERVTLEPVGSTGADPFTDSVAITEVAEFPDAVAATVEATVGGFDADPETGGLATTGATPGLYGGSQEEGICDVAGLVDFLTDPANAEKAAAFAGTQGLAPADLEAWLPSLTPVMLVADAVVTNHGFRDGAATSFTAVLQAGTAVLVDTTGTPRVKCSCGNPLSPPPARVDLTYTTGRTWATYQPRTTITIAPAPEPVTDLTLVDTVTGDTFQEPVGAPAGSDLEWRPDGIGLVPFGTPRAEAVAAVTELLGEPTDTYENLRDSLISAHDPLGRAIIWPGLRMFFAEESDTFTEYDAFDPTVTGRGGEADAAVLEAATPEGVGLGAPADELFAAHPGLESWDCGGPDGYEIVTAPAAPGEDGSLRTAPDGYHFGVVDGVVTGILHNVDEYVFSCI